MVDHRPRPPPARGALGIAAALLLVCVLAAAPLLLYRTVAAVTQRQEQVGEQHCRDAGRGSQQAHACPFLVQAAAWVTAWRWGQEEAPAPRAGGGGRWRAARLPLPLLPAPGGSPQLTDAADALLAASVTDCGSHGG